MKYKGILFAMNLIWAISISNLVDDIEMHYKEANLEGVEWINLAQKRLKMARSREHSNEPSSSAKCVEFFT
jgi:hypothetical protein